jgi:hydrogenase maturation protease
VGRTLVAGVGYGNLRDMSVGPRLVERLQARAWPPDVEVEDMSYGAVAALHWFKENPDVEAAIFVTAAERGQPPGTVRRFLRGVPDASPTEVQARVEAAVTGIVDLETILTVVGHFGALPGRVVVIEVEPRDHAFGPELSPDVALALARVELMVEAELAGAAA